MYMLLKAGNEEMQDGVEFCSHWFYQLVPLF